MNTTKKISLPKGFLAVLLLTLFLAPSAMVTAATFVPLTAQMGIGARGTNVINLQTFLAANPSFYPEGLITGYYGNLTAAAVTRLQANYGIYAIGRVGPMTLAKINSLIALGYNSDTSAPIVNSVATVKTGNSASISWATNEVTHGKIYYSSSPLQLREATGDGEPTIINAVSTAFAPNVLSSQTVTIQNLQPNTNYYYIIVVTDAAGNISVSVPGSFTTNS